jgi:uncharacterized protein (TIGR02145 family)
MILFVSALTLVAQDIDLSGNVTNATGGSPLGNVIVTLKNTPQCIDTTGADGMYRLLATTGVTHRATQEMSPSQIRLRSGVLEIGVAEREPVTVETYSLGGALIARLAHDDLLGPGLYTFDMRTSCASTNMFLIKIRQGDNATTYPVLPMNASFTNNVSTGLRLAKAPAKSGAFSAAFTDTIIFTLSGFTTAKKAVTAATGVNNIAMQPQQGNTVTDTDGNVYHTVTIGTQVWMVENLKTTRYNDGNAIPLVTDASWGSLTTPGYCWYNNDTINKADYGALYNWYVVNTGKLAPTGWHVPTDAELMALVNYLGGADSAGGKLKEAGSAHWDPPNVGATNESGFTGRAGGSRHTDHAIAGFVYIRGAGSWWATTEDTGNNNNAWNIVAGLMTAGIYHIAAMKVEGYSVRCLRD